MDIKVPLNIPIKVEGPIPEPISPDKQIPITIGPDGFKRHPLLRSLGRIDLDLTGLCNRQCTFCPRSLDADPVYPNINKHMTLETIEIVLSEMRSINFSGAFELAGRGESTLHKQFDKVVDMIAAGPRKWQLRLTTNGYRIEDWWDTLGHKFDELILNSYESKEQYIERQAKYVTLPNGKPVRHYYKQDGFSIEQINKMPAYRENGKSWVHAFNNRAGYFKDVDRRKDKLKTYTDVNQKKDGTKFTIEESPCWHPMRQIFIDFEGNYQMCCNDWSYQIKIGNVHERSLIDMYINDPKLNRIRWHLINAQRNKVLPCAKCDDLQGATKHTASAIQNFKNSNSYKVHVIESAKCGRVFDQQLKQGI